MLVDTCEGYIKIRTNFNICFNFANFGGKKITQKMSNLTVDVWRQHDRIVRATQM
jgi:hypothetical protein